LFEDHKKLG